ncbi:MAG: hypothetical protein KatS3mg027_2131 [Bacteroidia bacterium]|nr:MAG: hypothetical protein KatS3mg027_2131 [Bacteroidia bacterium]
METTVLELDVRLLPPREKHPTIFSKFDSLKNGESMIILNDHDPKPLYYQMLAERGNIFEWEYLEEGPVEWRVKITKHAETIGEIAAKDMRKVKVFMKYGIDFCCGGKKTIQEACVEAGVDYKQVEQELSQIDKEKEDLDFNSMPLHELTAYIINKHHRYIKENKEALMGLALKVAERHGGRHPELSSIYKNFNELVHELDLHLMKEENILFPYIDEMSKGEKNEAGFGSVRNPIRMMEHEHDIAGNLIKEIRALSSNYTAPEDACNSYNALYRLLKEFDEDLMTHIHLENNILFPRAIELENKLMA